MKEQKARQGLVWAPGWSFAEFENNEAYGLLYLFKPGVPREWLVYDIASGQIVAVTYSISHSADTLFRLTVGSVDFLNLLKREEIGVRVAA